MKRKGNQGDRKDTGYMLAQGGYATSVKSAGIAVPKTEILQASLLARTLQQPLQHILAPLNPVYNADEGGQKPFYYTHVGAQCNRGWKATGATSGPGFNFA